MRHALFSAFVLLLALAAPAGAEGTRHVLFLADSHALGPFGDAFERELVADGRFEVETYAVGGSAPSWFFHGTKSACAYFGNASKDSPPPASRKCRPRHTPFVNHLLRKGELVVVALGTNQIDDPLGWDYGLDTIAKLAAAVREAGADCVWIAPPRMRRFSHDRLDGFYRVIARALRTPAAGWCPLIDSRDLTEYPPVGGDGIHYSFPAGDPVARSWGRVAALRIKNMPWK